MLIKFYLIVIIIVIILVPVKIFAQGYYYKIHPTLQEVLLKSSNEEMIDVYLKLNDQFEIDKFINQNSYLSKKDKRIELLRALKDFAFNSQQNLLAFLTDAEELGKVKKIQTLWTLNYIIFSSTPEIIYTLVNSFDEIKEIRYDPKYLRADFGDFSFSIDSLNLSQPDKLDLINPGLTLMNVPAVWEAGDTGQGVLVASIDEGCGWTCPDLVNQLWQNIGEDADGDGRVLEPSNGTYIFDPGDINGSDDDHNGYIDDIIGWDFEFGTNNVLKYSSEGEEDGTSHGTATACIVVGDGTKGTQTGVAPGAEILNLRIGASHTGNFLASQYALDFGAQIITQSQSFKWYETDVPDYAAFRDMAVVELAAGVIHFNSISNDGNGPGVPVNIGTPGNCPPPWLNPDQTLIGGLSSIVGVGNVDAADDLIHYTSPYGPTAWEDYDQYYANGIWYLTDYPYNIQTEYRDYPYALFPGGIGLIKPDISAPGAHTKSMDFYRINETTYGYSYMTFGGTSGATPHAAGVAALLLNANPNLTPRDICRILEITSVDKGDHGMDNRYGAGRIDAYAAYQEAVNELPVELTSFSAVIISNAVHLNWETATEVNNYGFEVQKLQSELSSAEWESLGFIEGYGNSNSPKQYSFVDNAINGAQKFSYRLKQIDNDGAFEYSKIIEVDVTAPIEFSLSQNYPNPFNPSTTIKYSIPAKEFVSLKVFNILGKEVARLVNSEQAEGFYNVTFDGSGLSSGVYFYKLQAGSFTAAHKMLLIK